MAAVLAGYELAMRDAFEAAGVGFPFEVQDGQSRPAGVIHSSPESGEGSPSPSDLLRQLEAMQKGP